MALGVEQLELASTLGELTGDTTDKLGLARWHSGPHGVPILDDAPVWMVGAVIERVAVGDHVAHLLDLVAAEGARDGFEPLRLHQVAGFDAGHDA